MSSNSQTETSHIPQVHHHSVSYSLDMNSVDFRATVDMGRVKVGTMQVRCTAIFGNVKLDLTDNICMQRGGMLAQDLLAKVNKSPSMVAAMDRMRRRVAASIPEGEAKTVASLRLAAGLSQTQLAERMGTQQPNVARWEREPGNMTYQTILRMAAALGVSRNELTDAIDGVKSLEEVGHERV
jgi:DNA-binding transcriptional regulator YiaG